MGTGAALSTTSWVGGYDMTGDLNATTLAIGHDVLDATVFISGTGTRGRVRQAGLQSVASEVAGLWQSAASGAIDPEVFNTLGVAQPVTQSVSGTAGDVAYLYQSRHLQYSRFGKVGELIPFELAMRGTRGAGLASVGAVRGQVAAAKGNVSATGVLGSGVQLGAVGASQWLYATLHVFTAGTTITLRVESDDNPGFSSPTTRIATIGPITAVGGTWATRLAGPVTDTYFRFNVTAITGTFNVAGAIGIK